MNNISQKSINIHGSCVAIKGQGVLLLGDSGSGKSDLAIRLTDRGATLVSDDRVELTLIDNQIIANPAANIEGLIELYGIGIIKVATIKNIPLKLVVRLVANQGIERMPEVEYYDCLGIKIREIKLNAFDISTPIKIELIIM